MIGLGRRSVVRALAIALASRVTSHVSPGWTHASSGETRLTVAMSDAEYETPGRTITLRLEDFHEGAWRTLAQTVWTSGAFTSPELGANPRPHIYIGTKYWQGKACRFTQLNPQGVQLELRGQWLP